ncbi:MAG TPA: glycosyltransferase family 2 protein [Anaerolineales bacterium]|nr:glycosyltransferase family 2 protein [Anaerolineales bacterium]
MPAPQLTVIIPAYNEAKRIVNGLTQTLNYLHSQAYTWELIVVNDGSRDNTAEIVRSALASEPNARLIDYQPNQGKGHAIRTGVLAATGEWVVFLDADMSTPVEEIDKAIDLLQQGYQVVVGSRRHPESQVQRKASAFRQLGTAIFDFVRTTLVGLHQFNDTQCGFKAYQRSAAVPLYQASVINRFMFDVEILFLAQQSGLRMVEMPVRWMDAEGSTVRFLPGLYQMFRDLTRIRWVHRGWGKKT